MAVHVGACGRKHVLAKPDPLLHPEDSTSCACMMACGCTPDAALRRPATGLGGLLSLLLSALAIFASMASLGTLFAAAIDLFFYSRLAGSGLLQLRSGTSAVNPLCPGKVQRRS